MSVQADTTSNSNAQDTGPSKLSAFGSAFVAQGFTMFPVLLLLIIVGAFRRTCVSDLQKPYQYS